MSDAELSLARKELETLATVFQAAPALAESARAIFVSASEAWQLTIEVHASLRSIELQYAASAERARLAAPIVEKSLDGMMARADKILDRVLNIDARTCQPEDLAIRGELLSLVRELNGQIVSMLSSFLRI